MTTALTKTTPLALAAEKIDQVSNAAMELFGATGSFQHELVIAQSISDLRALLTPEVMQPIMALMNTPLGFLTDKDPSKQDGVRPYDVNVVRDCVIEAKLRGFHVCGNEFNIISGRFYAAKNGLRRKVSMFPCVTEFKDSYGVPRMVGDKGALVVCKATWKRNGMVDFLEAELPIKVNSFMGSDAILGKAERKLLKRVLDRLSGIPTPDGDIDDSVVDVTAAPQPQPEQPSQPSMRESAKASAEPADDIPMSFLSPNQKALAEYLSDNKVTFDNFASWAKTTGRAKDADTWAGYESVPEALCVTLQNSPDVMARIIKVHGGKA